MKNKRTRYIDITNQKFGRLTVLHLVEKRINRAAYWYCKCDCGKTLTICSQSLRAGRTSSCGCLRRKDVVGQQFGKLKVLEYAGSNGNALWKCLCDCGKTCVILGTLLRQGRKKTCGCTNDRRLSQGVAGFNNVYSSYKRTAKKRKIEFLLSKEEFYVLSQKDCYYCGEKPSNRKLKAFQNGEFVYNGIDRIDSAKSYTTENSASCCMQCNRAKSTLPINDFMDWIKKVYGLHKKEE